MCGEAVQMWRDRAAEAAPRMLDSLVPVCVEAACLTKNAQSIRSVGQRQKEWILVTVGSTKLNCLEVVTQLRHVCGTPVPK